jgi:hypothetical protein
MLCDSKEIDPLNREAGETATSSANIAMLHLPAKFRRSQNANPSIDGCFQAILPVKPRQI